MAIQGVSIALSTEDVARSVRFYVEQLGFTAHYNWMALHAFGWARRTLCSRGPMTI
jgi:catechol 2,3-dioxygenase-like lactoylglutathione lyase family enzyme